MYVHVQHQYMYTCICTSTSTNIYTIYPFGCRAWQRKLHSLVKVDTHKAEIYKYLWMLMTEGEADVFTKNLHAFLQFWETKEPQFISYFKQNYACRAGVLSVYKLTNNAHSACPLQKSGHYHIDSLITRTLTPTCLWKGMYYYIIWCVY